MQFVLRRVVPKQGRSAFSRTVIKAQKDRRCPFPKPAGIGTYPSHRGLCPGCLLRKPPDWDRSTPWRWPTSFRLWFSERFGAGWSSPVARQAHNLKVIGSNPIPATKHLIDISVKTKSRPLGGFSFLRRGDGCLSGKECEVSAVMQAPTGDAVSASTATR